MYSPITQTDYTVNNKMDRFFFLLNIISRLVFMIDIYYMYS